MSANITLFEQTPYSPSVLDVHVIQQILLIPI